MSFEYSLMTPKLLLVDEDLFLTEVLRKQLSQEGGMEFQSKASISAAKALIFTFKPDILLLNVRLSDGSGIDFCNYLRQMRFEKPIIMLIEHNSQNLSIDGLNAGANDYITKPLRINDLVTRIKIQLRQFSSFDAAKFSIGSLEFVPAKKILATAGTPEKILLTEKETSILKILVQFFPKSVSKDILLKEVWGIQADLSTHTLETHVYRLRLKIKNLKKETFIQTTEDGYALIIE